MIKTSQIKLINTPNNLFIFSFYIVSDHPIEVADDH